MKWFQKGRKNVKIKCKYITCWAIGGLVPVILNLRAWWNQEVSFRPRSFYPRRKNVGPSCHRTGDRWALETSENGGGEKNSLCLAGNKPRFPGHSFRSKVTILTELFRLLQLTFKTLRNVILVFLIRFARTELYLQETETKDICKITNWNSVCLTSSRPEKFNEANTSLSQQIKHDLLRFGA